MEIDLSKLGLTKGESKVYNVLINHGTLKAGEITRYSRVSYSKVYEVLDRLIEKGLVSFILKNKIKHFSIVEPHKLVEYLDKKEKELENQKEIIENLINKVQESKENKAQTNAEVFMGLNGLKSAYKIILNDSNKGDIFRYFFPLKDYDEVICTFYERLHAFQKSKELDERGIAHLELKQSNYYKKVGKYLSFKFVDFPIPSTIEILNNYVLIVSWESKMRFLITSQDIAKQFNNYFDEIWTKAKK